MDNAQTQIYPSAGRSFKRLKVIAVAQVEDKTNLEREIAKQTYQPDSVAIIVDDKPRAMLNDRRKRIAENHKLLKSAVELSDADLVWQLEQDSVLPVDCLERLLVRYANLSNIDNQFGYVSGVQVGRHGIQAIGAWHIYEDWFESLDHHLGGLNIVDATGFYCLLAERDVWLKGEASWNGEPYGPDVVWALSLRQKGYIIYADMDLEIGHRLERTVKWPHDINTCNVRFYKENERWKYKIS